MNDELLTIIDHLLYKINYFQLFVFYYKNFNFKKQCYTSHLLHSNKKNKFLPQCDNCQLLMSILHLVKLFL